MQAVEEREAALRRAALSYEDAEVVVEVVRELELAGATTFAGAHVLSLLSIPYIPAKPLQQAGAGVTTISAQASGNPSALARAVRQCG